MDVTASDIARDDMAQFTRNVQAWLQLDAQVTEMSKSVRSRRRLQRQLSSIILDFMQKHNIEDLNTSEGTLRCKVRTVKAPLNQTCIRERISTLYEHEPAKLTEVFDKVFGNRDTIERVALQRIRST